MRQKWFGYVDENNEVVVSVYSRWDEQHRNQLKCCVYKIDPFYADNYIEAKKIAEKKRDEILFEEVNKIKEV